MLWRPNHHRRLAQLADALTTAFSFVAAYFVWDFSRVMFPWAPVGREIEITSDLLWRIPLFAIIWVVILTKLGAYTYQRFTSFARELKMVLNASLIGTLILFAAVFILRFEYIPRTYVGIFFIVNFLSLTWEKAFLFEVAKKVRGKGENRRKVIVVGCGLKAKDFIETVEGNLGWGLDIVGVVVDRDSVGEKERFGKKILGGSQEMAAILHQYPVDEVIVCASGKELGRLEFEEIFEICEREGVQIRVNSDFLGKLTRKVAVDHIYGLSIMSFLTSSDNEWALYLKR